MAGLSSYLVAMLLLFSNADKSPGLKVESEGFEPSSKRRLFKLSTCLVSDYFSIKARTETPKTLT